MRKGGRAGEQVGSGRTGVVYGLRHGISFYCVTHFTQTGACVPLTCCHVCHGIHAYMAMVVVPSPLSSLSPSPSREMCSIFLTPTPTQRGGFHTLLHTHLPFVSLPSFPPFPHPYKNGNMSPSSLSTSPPLILLLFSLQLKIKNRSPPLPTYFTHTHTQHSIVLYSPPAHHLPHHLTTTYPHLEGRIQSLLLSLSSQ